MGQTTSSQSDITAPVDVLNHFFGIYTRDYLSGPDAKKHRDMLEEIFRDPRNINGINQLINAFISNKFTNPNTPVDEGSDLDYCINNVRTILEYARNPHGTRHNTGFFSNDDIFASMGVIWFYESQNVRVNTGVPSLQRLVREVANVKGTLKPSDMNAAKSVLEQSQDSLFEEIPLPAQTLPTIPEVPSSTQSSPMQISPALQRQMEVFESAEKSMDYVNRGLEEDRNITADLRDQLSRSQERLRRMAQEGDDVDKKTYEESMTRSQERLRRVSMATTAPSGTVERPMYLTSGHFSQQIVSTAPNTTPTTDTKPVVISDSQTVSNEGIRPLAIRFDSAAETGEFSRGFVSNVLENGIDRDVRERGMLDLGTTDLYVPSQEERAEWDQMHLDGGVVEEESETLPVTVPMPPRFDAGPPRIHPLIRVGDETFDLEQIMNIPEFTGETPEQENQRRQQLIDYHFFDPNRIEIDARAFPSEIPAVSSAREITISRVVNDFPAQQRTYSIERPVEHGNLTITGSEPVPPQRVQSRSEVDVRNVFDYRRLPGMTDPMPFRRPVDRPSDVRPNPSQPLPLYRENHASGPHGPRVHVPLLLRHPPVVAAAAPPAPPGAPPPPGGPGGNRKKKNSINPIRARGNGSIRQATPYKKIDYEPLVRPVAMDKLALGAIGVAAVAPLISPCFCRCVCTA